MSQTILAVDTTGEHGSLALARGAAVLEELPIHAPSGFAHILYDAIGGLLARCGVALADIDCFAAAAGPGSFTGVRVGLACVKGLAEAGRKPAVAVSNLAALARFGQGPLRAPIVDARRGEIYGAVYDAAGALVRPRRSRSFRCGCPPCRPVSSSSQRISPPLTTTFPPPRALSRRANWPPWSPASP